MATLQEILIRKCGEDYIYTTELPSYVTSNLSPSKPLREYQKKALQFALTYFKKDFPEKESQPDLLFQMSTGSGKTLMMAAMILMLYKEGYRNFLFFVNRKNIIGKTKENFFNPASCKYLFADKIIIDDQHIAINQVKNFQYVSHNAINICLTNINKLHGDLNNPKEGCPTFDDFASFKTVLISDETHHINATTRKKTTSNLPGMEKPSWENTIMRVFQSNENNILLEFSATAGMEQNANIAAKYEPKLIYDYSLKQFRKDRFSKEIETVQNSANNFQRALSAVILSQYKLKTFEMLGFSIKPVIMFKSKLIQDNKDFYKSFIAGISHLSVKDIEEIRKYAKDDLGRAFEFFDKHGINLDNLVLEIKEDFSSEKLLIIDKENIEEDKQIKLHNLEDTNNLIRGIFAVDMLNEGWDVLNLFDIVRMYDTRDTNTKTGKPGKTTIQEAQLIGRGARYMPFVLPNSTIPADKRKFDEDIDNPLRVIEKLHYHTMTNNRYIDELRKVLIASGLSDENYTEVTVRLKPEFKQTELYTHGVVFANERIVYKMPATNDTFHDSVLTHTFRVELPKLYMKSDTIFESIVAESGTNKYGSIKMRALGSHVIRAALNSNKDYSFKRLKTTFPPLSGLEEFINSKNFLAELNIDITDIYTSVAELTQRQKLFVAQQVLKQLSPMIFKKLGTFMGTRKFTHHNFSSVFKDHTLRFKVDPYSAKEIGRSMSSPYNHALRLNLNTCEWYAYDDCFGTSEEKYLIKYIESIIGKLREKYSDIYLVRNELDLKIYAFEDGAAFEPDFVLFMRHKESEGKFDNIQIFIEPKGSHIEAKDKWKEDFLLQIGEEAILSFESPNNKYRIWGLPFFNEDKKQVFSMALKEFMNL